MLTIHFQRPGRSVSHPGNASKPPGWAQRPFMPRVCRLFNARNTVTFGPCHACTAISLVERASDGHDLAPVSVIVRSVSDNVRRTTPPVSTNVRPKQGFILRRAVHDCATVHLGLVVCVVLKITQHPVAVDGKLVT